MRISLAAAMLSAVLALSFQAGATETVLIDNDQVRVTKVVIAPGETHTPSAARENRVVVPLNHHSKRRHAKAADEALSRDPGDAIWRAASSDHQITNTGKAPMESILVEVKPRP